MSDPKPAPETASPTGGDASSPRAVLFSGARVFDGRSDELTAPTSVLIVDGKIASVGGTEDVPSHALTIDADGRTLTPGFIDAHAHVMLQPTVPEMAGSDLAHHALYGASMAKLYLSRGYTTIRDTGGNTFSLKRAIDSGMNQGPRIYPSGPIISQTAGHGDFTPMSEPARLLGGHRDNMQRDGHLLVVDGVSDMLQAVRYVLGRGASQVKLAVGGGCASDRDPLDVTEFTAEEIEAAVKAAGDWNTYVATHVYNPTGIRRAVEAGARTIEHGNLVDAETLELMKDHGTWLCPQVIVYVSDPPGLAEVTKEKFAQAREGLDTLFELTKKTGFDRIGFGSDIISAPDTLAGINEEFVHRTKWFSPAEILRQATGNNGRLVALAGMRNPYPGTLGVIEPGALADVLLVDGNPLDDPSVLTDPEQNLLVIVKDGQVVKNALADDR
ncbi:metal-dependent hydrolase family protein [Streptomyces sp. PsTaAH-124]|uniref:metal-dependent hydrolase family protein n=1 Tax=Streptomyces sp. PsTaAH-124 TaxID=1157638 RepID=UPI00039C050D|nr:amidohydrolase family protein [Streptomyces sp. PsTaAH-124]